MLKRITVVILLLAFAVFAAYIAAYMVTVHP